MPVRENDAIRDNIPENLKQSYESVISSVGRGKTPRPTKNEAQTHNFVLMGSYPDIMPNTVLSMQLHTNYKDNSELKEL